MLGQGLASLPGDILFVIIALVATEGESRQLYAKTVSRIEVLPELRSTFTGSKHPLLPLSMTCARFRTLCIPAVFSLLDVDRASLDSGPLPLTVLARYRTIHLRHSRIQDHPKLEAVVLAATNLRELVHSGSQYDPVPPSLFTHPTITDITLRNPHITPDSPSLPVCRSLRAFRMVFGDSRWSRASGLTAAGVRAEREFILAQVLPNRLSLEELALPMESICLDSLVGFMWPSLLELTLAGEYIQNTEIELVDVLGQLPRLRVLVLAISPRRGESALYIWHPQIIPARPPTISNLIRLSLAFPHDDDLIFAHLPSGIVELALRDSPRAYLRSLWCRFGPGDPAAGGYASSLPLLRFAGAARIFSVIPTQPYLQRLELVVQVGPNDFDTAEAVTYARAASVCPNLRVLELHRYRAAETPTVPVAAIVSALAAFRQLRELRLHLDFPQIGYFSGGFRDYHFTVESSKMAPIYDDAARLAAGAMPWLDRIVLLELTPSRLIYWSTWHVRASSDAVIVEKQSFLDSHLDLSSI